MATRHRSALALYDKQRAAFEQASGDAVKAWEMIPKEYEKAAYELLSGTLTPEQTRGAFARRGGPVARYNPRDPARAQVRARGRGSAPLLPINVQTGRLRQALLRQNVKVGNQSFGDAAISRQAVATQTVGVARSRSGDSIFVLSPEGTASMVSRTFWTTLRKTWRTSNRAFRDVFVRAQRKAMVR